MDERGDRLSSLPYELIHKILSFLDITRAIEISVLSSRWRYIWTSMPYLNFSSEEFHTLPEFSNFVSFVLSNRNKQTDVSSVTLTVHGKVSHEFIERILDYAFSHNVQQLNITRLRGKGLSIIEFPLCSFSSPYLKDTILPTWQFPALTTLNLQRVKLFDHNTGFFSNCANLKNLTLNSCIIYCEPDGFNICHDGLSNLTLENGYDSVNVVTPQLMNLTVINWSGVHLVSAPELAYLHYKGGDDDIPMKVSADLHLEKVDVCIQCSFEDDEYTRKTVCLLQQLRCVKFLTLNFELVELLSSSVEVISHQPSPFANLKSLKIYPAYVILEDQTQPEVTVSPEVKNFLLGSSSGATFTMVSHEEIRAVKNVVIARNLMRELQGLLNQWKENSEPNTTDMKASVENHMATVQEQVEAENQPDAKLKWQFGETMTHIENYWKDLSEQLDKGYKDTISTISILRTIEGVLAKLPTPHRDKLQARFSGLCAEAEIIMDNMMDRMKIQCDKKPHWST
ncbi:F-box/FBD/LRR-repeat protein At5g22700-like [Bidens hawaiensis]|uniref:F-box/FBD/LRR-repeat protein At5g22700-like n=1 Tax=Bidens hawaiensis TaxID=980011 RepID=UPI0040490911